MALSPLRRWTVLPALALGIGACGPEALGPESVPRPRRGGPPTLLDRLLSSEPAPPAGVVACDWEGDFFREAMWGCFIRVEGGSFLMGAQASDPGQPGNAPRPRPHEGPPREVKVADFWVQPMEVQRSLYRQCVERRACSRPRLDQSGSMRPTNGEEPGSANGVTFAEAQTYCAQLGGRLPTEAEWEYLARGDRSWRFPWGDEVHCAVRRPGVEGRNALLGSLGAGAREGAGPEPDEAAWDAVDCSQDGPPDSHPSRIYQPQDGLIALIPDPHQYSAEFGLYLLAGGLWEWVGDHYAPDAYQHGPRENPTGPASGDRRVQRGGGWMSSSVWEFRSAHRASLDPELRMPDVGFRCVVPEPGA